MEALGIDGKLLLAQLVNFVLFALIFKKFLYKPFKSYLEKQQNEENERARLLVDLQKKDEKIEIRQKEVLAEAQTQAINIIKDAESLAHAKKQELLTDAHDEAAKVKQKAEKDIAEERVRMYDAVRDRVVKTSETLTLSVLKDFIDEKQQKGLLEKVFEKLQKAKIYEN